MTTPRCRPTPYRGAYATLLAAKEARYGGVAALAARLVALPPATVYVVPTQALALTCRALLERPSSARADVTVVVAADGSAAGRLLGATTRPLVADASCAADVLWCVSQLPTRHEMSA